MKIYVLNKCIFVILSIFIFCQSMDAQDIHLSQYKEAPLLLNPALTSCGDSYWRAGMNFREQWNNVAIPYNTLSVFADKKVFLYSKTILVGAYLLVDQVHNKGLKKISAAPSFAYQLHYAKNSFTLGLQPGIGYYDISSSLTHPDQFSYETGNFDNNIQTEDTPDKYSKLFADIAIGVNWSRPIWNYFPQIGLAFYHINNPRVSIYSNNSYRLPVKSILNLNVPIPINTNFTALPSLLVIRQGKAQELMIGSDGDYLTSKYSEIIDKIFMGVHYRSAKQKGMNALVVILGLEFNNVRMAFSYDKYFNSSKNSALLGPTFELSIITSGINLYTDKFSIPCETY